MMPPPTFLQLILLLQALLLFEAPAQFFASKLNSRHPLSCPKYPMSISFYMHIVVQSHTNDFTAVLIVAPDENLPFYFGKIHTFDNPLTEGPLLNSTQVGRMQGWYGDIGQASLMLLLVQTATIQTISHKGTLNLLGVDVAADVDKPVPVVGGTRDFTLARGIAFTKLVSTQTINHQTVSVFYYNIQLTQN